jgi:hypothetical protein
LQELQQLQQGKKIRHFAAICMALNGNATDAAEVMQLRCCCNGSISAAQLVSTSAKDKSIAAEERRSRGKAALCDF